MAMEDEELLQDFIIEAGEILEQLNEQLVQLENRPKDLDLLNAVFRGFHTIKGGASFLSLDGLVDVCHRAEDVFNILRNGERDVDTELMDVMLPVLDVLNEQFDAIRSSEKPPPADPKLLLQLESLLVVKEIVKESNVKLQPELTSSSQSLAQGSDEITDEEFEKLLDTLEGKNKKASPNLPINDQAVVQSQSVQSDEITGDEFEALLDQLDAQKKQSVETPDNVTTINNKSQKATQEQHTKDYPLAKSGENSDDISEDEFDALLDELHGQNKGVNSVPAERKKIGTDKSAPAKRVPVTPAIAQESIAKTKSKESSTQAETTVRVDTKRLDDIMNMVGELVLVRNRMATLEAASNDEEMSKVVANLDVVTSDLQTAVMKTRMQPIKKVFGRFPRVVRDLARNLSKEVNLELQGEDTDLDKNLVEALADPLVHLVRNAVDHGIETPEEREKNGKPRVGTVILTAEQEGDHILLTIQDDGKGMDADQLRQAAVKKGLMDTESAARLDPKECYNLIFAPGFSTKTEISDVSGRGVGMDVVKTRIVQLNGSVEVNSEKNKGSIIIIKVPLTLAIMPTLMVMLEKQIFALPLASVNEIFHLNLTKTNVVDGQLVVMVRDKALPLYYLRHWLVKGCQGQALPKEGHVVVVSMGAQKIGFVVDNLIGQEEVVIKPLGALLHGMRGLAGATITGDGRISLILDIPGLMYNYARRI